MNNASRVSPLCDVCGEPIAPAHNAVVIQQAARQAHRACFRAEQLSRVQRQTEQAMGRYKADRERGR